MGKYLIIDKTKINAEFLIHTIQQGLKDRIILSEKETEAKFKEVWHKAIGVGSNNHSEQTEEKFWQEYKKENL